MSVAARLDGHFQRVEKRASVVGSAFHPRAVIERAGRQVREGPEAVMAITRGVMRLNVAMSPKCPVSCISSIDGRHQESSESERLRCISSNLSRILHARPKVSSARSLVEARRAVSAYNGLCKRRRENPSLKRPESLVAPEQKMHRQIALCSGVQRAGDEERGIVWTGPPCGAD